MTDVHEKAMRQAIDEAKRCNSQEMDADKRPKVGAVIVIDGEIRKAAYRGELNPHKGDHAEYTLLEGRLKNDNLTGATLYTTLEPCTERSPEKTPCASRVVARQVEKVVIGMLDPNPRIGSSGVRWLKDRGVRVEFFPPELAREIRDLNAKFIEDQLLSKKAFGLREPRLRTLDDWYCSINAIYLDKNQPRPIESVFTHLVEALGGVSQAVRKGKDNLTIAKEVVKTLAWWLALCGKARVRSVEEMVWGKFPCACPYCREQPHNDDKCKGRVGQGGEPDWEELARMAASEDKVRPGALSAWQRMFRGIYPTLSWDQVQAHLIEEIGELAETVRLIDVAPSYFLSEAADVFAWLAHAMNLIEEAPGDSQKESFFEKLLFEKCPNKCSYCGDEVCRCPAIRSDTVGRIAREAPPRATGPSGLSDFLSAAEILTLFDVSSPYVQLGGETLNAKDAQTSRDLVENSLHLRDRLAALPRTETIVKLEGALHNLWRVAAVERVNQAAVERLREAVDELRADERHVVKGLVDTSTYGPWQHVLSAYLGRV